MTLVGMNVAFDGSLSCFVVVLLLLMALFWMLVDVADALCFGIL